MFYIYSLQLEYGVYVGCTMNPMERWRSHKSEGRRGKFLLLHQTSDAAEAGRIEGETMERLRSVNTFHAGSGVTERGYSWLLWEPIKIVEDSGYAIEPSQWFLDNVVSKFNNVW